MGRRVTERDLRHDADPVRFGDTMLRCQNSSGDCASSGRCIYGDCFDTRAHIEAAKAIEALIPKDGRARHYHAYLTKCAEMLREDRICL